MRRSRVLITGGAGFIGSHLADDLLEHGYAVRALDALVPQVHGTLPRRPHHLHTDVELVVGDVRDAETVYAALAGVDAVVHLAAVEGVGQSMQQPARYTDVNCNGTAQLMEAMNEHRVPRLLVASSMSVYGEGAYVGPDGTPAELALRPAPDPERGTWDPLGLDGEPLRPTPTPETKRLAPASVYALSKHYQERVALELGAAAGIETTALRFFNVYGPRQAPSNPCTGVLAIFAARYLDHEPPLIYEDGRQRRDFVSVYDVARACRMALESSEAAGEAFNVGSGKSWSVARVAELLGDAIGTHGTNGTRPRVTNEYRAGDVRHCFADVSKAHELLGWRAERSLEDGLVELVKWLGSRDERSSAGGGRRDWARSPGSSRRWAQ